MRGWFAFLTLIFSTTGYAECPSGSVPVYVVAGQSNAVGSGEVSALPLEYQHLTQTDPGVLTWNYKTNTVEPLAIGVNNNLLHDWTGVFGPEAMITSELKKNSRSPFILFKYAVSGTSLEDDWNTDKNRSLYYQFVSAASDLNRALAQNGQTACYRAFFWIQGEADHSGANLRHYEKNFENFKKRVRVALGAMRLPFFLGRVTSPSTREFDAVQDRIARADPFVRLVETSGLSKIADNVHFDTLGQLELGRRFYKSYSSTNWDEIQLPEQTVLKAWPNPLRAGEDTFHVSIQTSVERCDDVTLEMFTLTGARLTPLIRGLALTSNADSSPYELSFPPEHFSLAAGTYVLRLHMDQCSSGVNSFLSQKLIILH